ncbi:hypothetical protein LAV84_22635 [Rhizobium sp. VS19-DR104.2]|uniref:hypothetical protein n=1 Tax=unclassified Rhizobium TaxID=2613769 RepID=UPI001CC562BD|nr:MULTISPECIES: hypothetical protein [unclassified Rhizobium]MBZ5761965.1 hypothetical protein [Rhizobium sp. VS19-DR96]MBZ5768389.1 hypothetical protein [Rhizobium sp. VS19-DR129.2]MBZ5775659.1 hypothetical protein [Rhizobium sp. VS19-DRK62.2]MBZ5786843.1 hypothetical protein [Rhizobium sp. VS19-DR121]MBZ5804413.1 hypothetical protein [Rhizobium sp. VS19-DR181]
MKNMRLFRSLYMTDAIIGLFIVFLSLLVGIWSVNAYHFDLSMPFVYNSGDATWQLVLSKMLKDTGWILTNPYLGAPDIASWHQNSAAQTSALHSVLMLGLGYFIKDFVEVQQVYFLLNFPLIALSSYLACRILKINGLPAAAVGLIFAFASFRYTYIIYSFLPNYAALPLGLVPVVWVGIGEFARKRRIPGFAVRSHESAPVSFPWSKFFTGIVFISLISLSDGYYAFFTLLLLGFVTIVRVFSGDLSRPLSLLPSIAFIVCLISVSTVVSFPLYVYKATHVSEFYPNGTIDPALVKHSFEAEVYSSSLKLMLAPIPEHRISILGNFGNKLVQTSDAARSFKLGAHSAPLGTIGAALLLCAFGFLLIPAWRSNNSNSGWIQSASRDELIKLLLSLILFGFLCSITGGIGSLIAIVFPTIRAYDRFPLVLLFLLLLFGARVVTLLQNRMKPASWGFPLTLACLVIACLFDQIPNSSHTSELGPDRGFIADRNFVKNIEAELKPGSMVYQYPYADYLIANKYYDWGSFAPVRLYLHSNTLRWSNGAAKNSYVENWHLRIQELPTDQMLNELAAVGFVGMVIDRRVVSDPEYNELAQTLLSRGSKIEDDQISRLSFATFGNVGFRLDYEPDYINAARLVVTDLQHIDFGKLPSLVNGTELRTLLAGRIADGKPIVFERSAYPALFLAGPIGMKGAGISDVSPTEMKGALRCSLDGGAGVLDSTSVTLNLTNLSGFDWIMGRGNHPIGLGFHVNDGKGVPVRFDNGTRLSLAAQTSIRGTAVVVKQGQSLELSVPTSELDLEPFRHSSKALNVEFGVVQDGNAWFAGLRCQVPLG